jgi:hypothetical protein
MTCIHDTLVSCFVHLARKDTILVCLVALCQVWWIESIPVMVMAVQGRMGVPTIRERIAGGIKITLGKKKL